MKQARRSWQRRFLWMAAGGGFAIGLAGSLLAGNLLWTSLQRGLVGFVLLFAVAWALQRLLAIAAATGGPEANGQAAGTRFDVSLPPELSEIPPSGADFQPWVIDGQAALRDDRIEEIVQAVRAMKD
ncbi:hypothetical protein [Effusibacillus pohliae]|uniref:hypothetical protein n=1 Tax=Effusibacillus pohliae TaxID=232270 RepID=UPI00036988FC|nr:hypothetical protein [Effusibacillus pohliae]